VAGTAGERPRPERHGPGLTAKGVVQPPRGGGVCPRSRGRGEKPRQIQIQRERPESLVGSRSSVQFFAPLDAKNCTERCIEYCTVWCYYYCIVAGDFARAPLGRFMSTRFEGQQRLVNATTGEIIDAQIVVKTAGDAGFHKIWLHQILELVEEAGNAKMRVLMWLLSKADAQNQIWATFNEIAEATDVSRRTVASLMAALRDANVITETRKSVWRLNPEVIFKGDHQKRMAVLIKYRDEKQGELFEEVIAEPLKAA
jgi:DNA-binding transcriptional ArsR family regulator